MRSEHFRPDLDVQKRILATMRDGYRAQGYEAECQAWAVEAIPVTSSDTEAQISTAVAERRKAADAAYAMARRLQDEIDAMEKGGDGQAPD